MGHRCPSRWLIAWLLLLTGWTGSGGLWAQTVSESMVKAGFIYNFIKFSQWPQTREGERPTLVICTPGTRTLDGHYLALNGRAVDGRRIEVRMQTPASDWRQCQMVFFEDADDSRLAASLGSLGNAPVLTVGDSPNFVQSGGMIGLRRDDSRVRFDINLGAAQRAGITLNSQMTKLAGEVVR